MQVDRKALESTVRQGLGSSHVQGRLKDEVIADITNAIVTNVDAIFRVDPTAKKQTEKFGLETEGVTYEEAGN